MKNKKEGKMENTEKVIEPMTIETIGKNIHTELSEQFKDWQNGLEYRFVLSSQAYRAKALGMDVTELAQRLQEMGYIKILRTPKGKKFVFAGDCPWSREEMQSWLQEQEILKESEKEFKKQLRSQA
jgi:NAD-dependent DNA ligase